VRNLVLGLIKRAVLGPNEPPRATSWRSDTGAVHFTPANARAIPVVAAVRSAQRRSAAARRKLLWRVWPYLVSAAVVGILLLRTNWSGTPDGDPALHLKLIKDVAATHSLPTELPYLVARVDDTGGLSMFPYGYTPVYHLVGGMMYALAGLPGVMMINSASAVAVVLVVYAFTGRRAPWHAAGLACAAAFLSPYAQVVFQEVYMEPLVLGLTFPAAWWTYKAMATRSVSIAIIAGLFMGTAIAVRQSALMYAFVLALVVLLHLATTGRLSSARRNREGAWIAAAVGALAIAAGPSLLYLAISTGSIGYADLTLPGMRTALAIDPSANSYIASITKPDASTLVWLDRYQRFLLYSDRWLPLPLACIPLLLFVAGAIHMHGRGGGPRFFARFALLEIAAEMILLVTLHGNPRYVVLSEMLFYSMAPIGAYAIATVVLRHAGRHNARQGAALLLGISLPIVMMSLVPAGHPLSIYLRDDERALRQFRGQEYAEMGAWVNENTAPDALILTPRTYTAELTWQRNVTWVTFYGNAWVVDAITTPDPGTAYALLRAHGVDYVLIQDPPGTYVDRMPATGMRSYLNRSAVDTPFFEIAHMTESTDQYGDVEHGLRLYRVQGDWEGLQ
jgi:hypothetical protein